jgi:signal transduction histidine kinase
MGEIVMTPENPSIASHAAEPSASEVETSVWHGRAGAIVLAIIAAIFIFVISVSADVLMLQDHEPARMTVEISDAISSAVIALLSYRLFRLQQQRREYVRHRVEVISDMNHHVRNALQVISLTTHGSSKDEITTIHESVNRIQWALRELLPKI